MSNTGLSITAGLLQGVGNYYDALNQGRRQKRQDKEDKEDRDYTITERKKKDLSDLAANFDDVNWQLSTTPEQQQTALQQYNAGAAEVGLPQRQIRDLVPDAMLNDVMKLKQAGYCADQTKVFLAKTYGNDRLQQFLGGQMMPSVPQSQQNPATASDLANASTQQAPASAAAPGTQVSTPQYPAYLSSNYLGGLDTGSMQDNQAAPTSAVAGSTEEVGQQPSDATVSSDTLSTLFTPLSNSKTVTADRKMLGSAIVNGTMSNKDAVGWWSKNHPDIQTPDELFLLKPKPSVTNQVNKFSAEDKKDARKYYRQMRQQAMQGKVSKDEWYSDPILKVNKFPGLSSAAQLSQDKTEQAMTLAMAASDRANAAADRAAARAARGSGDSRSGNGSKSGVGGSSASKMSAKDRGMAQRYGFSSASINAAPQEVLNNIGVMMSRGQIKHGKAGNYVTPAGRKAVMAVNAKYGGKSVSSVSTSFRTQRPVNEIKSALQANPSYTWGEFWSDVQAEHPGWNKKAVYAVYQSAKRGR